MAIPREPNPYIAPRTVDAFGTFATKQAAPGIPVVFAVTANPVGSGLVESGADLARSLDVDAVMESAKLAER